MTDLLKLAERVEASEFSSNLSSQICNTLKLGLVMYDGIQAATSKNCLTSASALHDAVLPGWDYIVHGPSRDNICWVDVVPSGGGEVLQGMAPTPAAAWVAAILRAVHAQNEK